MISPAWAGMRRALLGTPGDVEPPSLPFLLGDSCVWEPADAPYDMAPGRVGFCPALPARLEEVLPGLSLGSLTT